ncbi:UMP kinase [Candidatus Pacearchaeota archaeon]|nr:UMP kinase [Candidatus Pacearchaeota archaeon]
MKKKVIVMSLGGSQIIPDNVNVKYLRKLKKILLKHSKKYKFVIVCGGGSIARKYISALKKEKINEKLQSFAGIGATRLNARFMNYFFKIDPKHGIPHTHTTLKKYVKKQNITFCGALEYKPNQTSDSTAADIAKMFDAEFINITNIQGLYTKNPKKFKNAEFISKISWKEFDKMANAMKFKPGQHFVLDQTASKIIMKNKIKTYITGKSVKQIDNLLSRKPFNGTIIFG